MTLKQTLGAWIIATPFVALFVFLVQTIGLVPTVVVFSGSVFITACISGGIHLMGEQK